MNDEENMITGPAPKGFPDPTLWAEMQEGEEAITAIRKTFDHWLVVGRAFTHMQQSAMRLSSSQNPTGIRYNEAYATLDMQPGLKAVDKNTRKDAIWIFGNREAVTLWRTKLSQRDRDGWAHPSTVRRNFERYLRKEQGAGDAEPRKRRSSLPVVDRLEGIARNTQAIAAESAEASRNLVNAQVPDIFGLDSKEGRERCWDGLVERYGFDPIIALFIAGLRQCDATDLEPHFSALLEAVQAKWQDDGAMHDAIDDNRGEWTGLALIEEQAAEAAAEEKAERAEVIAKALALAQADQGAAQSPSSASDGSIGPLLATGEIASKPRKQKVRWRGLTYEVNCQDGKALWVDAEDRQGIWKRAWQTGGKPPSRNVAKAIALALPNATPAARISSESAVPRDQGGDLANRIRAYAEKPVGDASKINKVQDGKGLPPPTYGKYTAKTLPDTGGQTGRCLPLSW
jgi:hypothetical protein